GDKEALMGRIYGHAARRGPIVVAPKFGRVLSLVYKSERAKMLEKQLITSKDLGMIWVGYGIPASIVLSAPAPHETSRDHRPWLLCLNEYMLGARVRIPFDFEVAEALWELLICQSFQGYAVFSTWRDVKAIDNPPNHVLRWESRLFFARLSSERDTWGIPEQWEEPLLDLIPWSYVRLFASQWWTLIYFRGTALCWHPSREEFFH
ncbi:hypothetical protein ACLOJK_034290, partial [Asimina triloba]